MVMNVSHGDLIAQGPPATTRPAQSAQQAQEAATAARDAQRVTETSVRDQIREQIRTQVRGAATQRRGDGPAPPAEPNPPRTFTIRGPNGEQTIIGMPAAGDIIPPQAVDISLAFFFTVAAIIIGLPIARAFARRMDRKGGSPPISNEVSAQLSQLNQAVDAIALEVERISEGQRFTTRLLSEQRDAARQTLPSVADR
jgi:hypothetical protein